MKQIRVIHNTGIFIDTNDKDVFNHVHYMINRQLKGFSNEGNSEYKLIFKAFNDIDHKSLNGTIIPGNSINTGKLFINFFKKKNKFAFDNNIEDKKFTVYLTEKTSISIPYLLHFLFKQQNLFFVHAAGFSHNNKGVLLPAFGGIGKTILLAAVMQHPETMLLGDDLVLLSEHGHLFPYLRPFCLYHYHKPVFPEYFENHKVVYRKKNFFNRVIRKIQKQLGLKEYILDFELAPPADLFDAEKLSHTVNVPLDKVYILRRKVNIDAIEVEETDLDFITSFVVNVIFHEWWSYLRMEYRWAAENGILRSKYLASYESKVRNGLSRAREYKIINIPENMRPLEFQSKILDTLLL